MINFLSSMKIKFCGFRRVEDIEFAVRLGVDLIGIIFYEKSKRFVSIEEFETIQRSVKANFVGVFVNEELDKVVRIAKNYSLAFVQLHGEENNEYVSSVLSQGVNVIKAFRLKDLNDIQKVIDSVSEYVLVDSFVEGSYGGTGRSIPKEILEELFSKVKNKKIFLSGGINTENIETILKAYGSYLYGIDLSSGIEDSPGVKNHHLMEEVFRAFVNNSKGIQP